MRRNGHQSAIEPIRLVADETLMSIERGLAPTNVNDGDTPLTKPGWYEDPWEASAVRWWNGVDWTEHTKGVNSSGVPIGWRPVNGGEYYAYWDGMRWAGVSGPSGTSLSQQDVAKGARNGILSAVFILFVVIPGVLLGLMFLIGFIGWLGLAS